MEELELTRTLKKTDWVSIQLRYDRNSEAYKRLEEISKEKDAPMATIVKAMINHWFKKIK